MADREEIVTRLVLNVPVSASERASLGGFVARDEIVDVIERQLHGAPRFPSKSQDSLQIEITATGFLVFEQSWGKRRRVEFFQTRRKAIERYIELEFGTSCAGLAIRG